MTDINTLTAVVFIFLYVLSVLTLRFIIVKLFPGTKIHREMLFYAYLPLLNTVIVLLLFMIYISGLTLSAIGNILK
jgi:hypothetical protein